MIKRIVEDDKRKHEKNPNALACFLPQRVFPEVPVEQLRKHAFYTLENIVSVEAAPQGKGMRLSPFRFRDVGLSKATIARMERAGGEWIDPDELTEAFQPPAATELTIIEDARATREEILEQVSDEDGTSQLLRFIKSIPKIKFRLTGEQDLMISTPENLLCLGRSGTGKTTSSALRLFASDAFFKFKEQLLKFKAENPGGRNKDFQISEGFMELESNLRLLFVSASPVLVNEVKRFYVDLKVHLRDQLINHRAKKIAAAQAQEESKGPGPARAAAQPAEEAEPTEQELLEKFVQAELEQLQGDEQIER